MRIPPTPVAGDRAMDARLGDSLAVANADGQSGHDCDGGIGLVSERPMSGVVTQNRQFARGEG